MTSTDKTFGKTVHPRKRKSEATSTNNTSENKPSKIYLKAMPFRNLSDLKTIKHEIKSGNILILKISPLANKSIESIKKAVNELCKFVKRPVGRQLPGQSEGKSINKNMFPNIDSFLHRPIISDPPMCTLKELEDGTYSREDLSMMNEILDLKIHMSPKPKGKLK